ncbi:MAG: nickel pincer cofactor biosynthesis protein LarC [Candidatus Rokubacteria bacterium]|nr:nickel pincer cofactor biosynthesis protein LarC [Candidatus Rokubacteria bacterium]
MRIAYFDCPSGAAGDMIMGALVDAGAPFDALRAALHTLPLGGWELTRREVTKGAFRATKVDVEIAGTDHPHRTLADVLAIIQGSGLPEPVKERAARIFRRLAEAEARVHGTTPDRVHFHDVGAVDAIVDVTGAAMALALLQIDAVHVSALPLGGGFVTSTHGRIPIPGPGTAELLRGFPVVDTGVRAELVTPTGAAILTTVAAAAGRMPPMVVESVGYGAGAMDLPDTPNVLRCFVGTASDADAPETIVQVATTIDDMSPQLYEPLMDRLFEAGALDVFLTPVVMKKSRPGVVLTALCSTDAIAALSRVLFEESTTIGVRWSECRRVPLPREVVTCATAYGPIAVKVSRLEGRVVTVTPEFSDVARIAREKSLPVREVLDQARADARRLLTGERETGPGDTRAR